MSDFSDRPFVAGSLVGLRAFDVDSLGRLTGPSFGGVFRPGENAATCGGGRAELAALHRAARDLARVTSRMQLTYGGSSLAQEAVEAKQTPHVTAGKGCACGFYAYLDGTNTYAKRDRVTAVIEGYGVCTVGERGFRAEKARLLAIVLPGEEKRRHWEWYDRLSDRCYGGNWDASVSVLSGVAAVALTVSSIGLAIDVSSWFALLGILAPAFAAMAIVLFKASFHGIDRQHSSVRDLSDCYDHVSRDQLASVRRNYPDVPIYRTERAALKAHPLTPPEPITPDTAEDFWTRSAS